MATMISCPLGLSSNFVRHTGHPSLSVPFTLPQVGTSRHLIGTRCAQRIHGEPSHGKSHNPRNFECPIESSLSSWEVIPCDTHRAVVGCLGAGTAIFFTLALTGGCNAAGIESQWEAAKALLAQEPKNALSLPTWAIHVSSVVEWMTAMALVWQYGDKTGNQAWKGLSWGMVPLLGGAMCACTWHFFYNAESLEILVVMQAALTVVGNFTMWVAAFRIYESTNGGSKAS